MSVKVKTQYVSSSIANKVTNPGTNPVSTVTIHQTANTSKGADAQAHANLQSGGNSRNASWHETVDDTEAVISFHPSAKCWHAGTGNGNNTSYAIEICVNSDGDYNKAIDNGAQRAAYWLTKYGHPISALVQHNHWSGKNCPTQLRDGKNGISWSDFVNMVKGYMTGSSSGSSSGSSGLSTDGKWGSGTTKKIQGIVSAPYKDGEVSRQNAYWEKSNPGCTTGWEWLDEGYGDGSQTITLMMKYLKNKKNYYTGKFDGLAGEKFFKALQKYVTDLGYYSGAIDGEIWKPSTCVEGMQKAINAKKFMSDFNKIVK